MLYILDYVMKQWNAQKVFFNCSATKYTRGTEYFLICTFSGESMKKERKGKQYS
jgi:hypothetical protein